MWERETVCAWERLCVCVCVCVCVKKRPTKRKRERVTKRETRERDSGREITVLSSKDDSKYWVSGDEKLCIE